MVNDAAYATCLRLARRHYENFPVASWLWPRADRPHVAAVYAFARTADDFADEGTRTPDERLALLDDWRARLHAAANGHPVAGGAHDAPHIFAALGETMRSRNLEVTLFDDLLSAFRQDVLVTRYERWDDVLDYCRRSANPVGRIVLRIAGYRDPALDAHADAVCTALQLTNFWQDLERDWHKGRLYVPREFVRDAGAVDADLDTRELTGPWRSVLTRAAGLTRTLFAQGRAVADEVGGCLRWELRATWLGGTRVLDRLERGGFDVFHARPTLGASDVLPLAWRLLSWR